jgi:hypothetical protein
LDLSNRAADSKGSIPSELSHDEAANILGSAGEYVGGLHSHTCAFKSKVSDWYIRCEYQ